MNTFLKRFFFLIQFIIYNIKSFDTVQLWENEKNISKTDGNIVSYAFDGETGAEIYLKSNKLIYKTPTTSPNEISLLNSDITFTSIENLFEIDSTFYFIVSSKILFWIDANGKHSKNPDEIANYKKKFFRDSDHLLVAILGSQYFYWFNLNTKDYDLKYDVKERIILGVGYVSNNQNSNNQFLILEKNTNNYYFYFLKRSNNDISKEKEKEIPISKLNIYDNNEMYITAETAYVFSYDSNTGEFSFYLVDLAKGKDSIDLKYFFRFFNDFKIKYVKFIENTTLLYYSIESLKKDKKSYIGIVDFKNNLLLFNVEENVNKNLYFNSGNYFNNQRNLFYFRDSQKVSFCPFIKEKEKCIYDNLYIEIIENNDGFYKNIENKDDCNNKKKLENYCVEYCPVGFKNENGCIFCKVFEDKFSTYKSHTCIDFNDDAKEKYKCNNGICYDCQNDIDNRTIFYENDCIDSCERIYGEYNESTGSCESCKSQGKLYSLKNKICEDKKDCNSGGIDEYLSTCEECEYFGKIYYRYNYSCIEECNDFLFVNENFDCHLCDNDIYLYYQDGECVKECDNEKGYGFNTKIVLENIFHKYCIKCSNDEYNTFLKGKDCTASCGENSLVDKNKVCKSCNARYYVEKAEICLNECPIGSSLIDTTCSFCSEDKFYYNGECKSKCGQNQIYIDNYYNNNSDPTNPIHINYKECIDCNSSQLPINNECRNCTEKFYSIHNEQCFECFCGNGQFNCINSNGQCDCSSSSNYYGYSCEFYSEKDIYTKPMKIISLNNRLIKTSQNYFTYSLNDSNTILSDRYNFEWKVYIDDIEITQNKKNKKFFITSTNEAVFGINKELFEKQYDKTINLSLSISYENKVIYYDIITLILIKSFEYENECNRGKSGNLGLYEMELLVLENKKIGNNKYNGRYLSQYRLLNDENEKLPITNFIDSDSININLICSKGFDINTINDRDEIQESTLISTQSCSRVSLSTEQIFEGNYYLTEKIYLLISYLKKNFNINKNDFEKINNFINERIPEIINENGYYIEYINNTNPNRNITYSEPKVIFSLINNLAYKSKDILTEENFDSFFNYIKNIFDIIFKQKPISQKTLSDSDIKSLFRTIDNLFDICIEKDFNPKKNMNNFIEAFENITKYLSYKTHPSETIRLIGNRISILSYHFGEHQRDISFPFAGEIGKVKINDFLTYSYDNYFLNEEICSQKNSSLFCFTQGDYNYLRNELEKQNYNLSDVFLNIYLLQEINKNNENYTYDIDDFFGYSEIIEKNIINKNYSIIFKFFQKENNSFSLIKDNDIDINLDVELPFYFGENKKDENNNVFSDNNYLNKKGWDIPLSPNNSEYTCIPKSFYENNKNEKNPDKIKYHCYTHFDYDKKKVRCSCNTKLNDEILIIKDQKLSETFKHIQFQKDKIKFINKYSLFIIYLFIFLLLIPIICFLATDFIKNTKIINDTVSIPDINDEDNELKTNYKKIKKYSKAGMFKFIFYLSLSKFPVFSEFNIFINNSSPLFIRHLIICNGFYLGIIFPLIPFYFIPFAEKQIFMDQRDINYDDDNHQEIKPEKYLILSIIFALIGIIFGNTFIYIFFKILKFEKEEIKIWSRIKELCKDYVYNKIKSEVLLGAIWKKIKFRIEAYYYICGSYILPKKKKNDKFNQYLKNISKNSLDYGGDAALNGSINIKFSKSKKSIHEPLLIKEDENENLIDNNKIINDDEEKVVKNRKRTKNSMHSNSSELYKKYFEFNYMKINKTDNFIFDNNLNDKSRKKIAKFEGIRNKYICGARKRGIDDELFDSGENKGYFIIKEISYTYISIDSFSSLINDNNEEKGINKTIYNYIIISGILFFIFIILLILVLVLLNILLERFGTFFLRTWIIPAILIITFLNFIFYYIKMCIGTILLFKYYHIRNSKWIVKCLFWIFVDKIMINKYKVRNLITKYQKEFNYL